MPSLSWTYRTEDENGIEHTYIVDGWYDPGRPGRYTMPPSKGVPEPPRLEIDAVTDEDGCEVPESAYPNGEDDIEGMIQAGFDAAKRMKTYR